MGCAAQTAKRRRRRQARIDPRYKKKSLAAQIRREMRYRERKSGFSARMAQKNAQKNK